MCGIVAYIGPREASDVIIRGLKRLEYRGYDSSGIALLNGSLNIYKKKGKVDRAGFEEIKEIVWRRCVLCTRCYCPLGIDIPEMIALARDICRSQEVYFQWSDLEQPAD